VCVVRCVKVYFDARCNHEVYCSSPLPRPNVWCKVGETVAGFYENHTYAASETFGVLMFKSGACSNNYALKIQEHRHFDRIIRKFNACVKRARQWTLLKSLQVCVTVWTIAVCMNHHFLLSKSLCPYPSSLLVAIEAFFPPCIPHGSTRFNRCCPWTSRLVRKWRSKSSARPVLPVLLSLSI